MYIFKKIRHVVFLNIFLILSSSVAFSAETENPSFLSHAVAENSIVIDGMLEDWSLVESLGRDGETLQGEGIKADIVEGWIAHDNNHLYIAYENSIAIDTSVRWPWQVYFDADGDSGNGYEVDDNFNAEYMLQGSGLYKYTGSGSNWSWQYIVHTENKVLGSVAEFKIPRLALGFAEQLRVIFKTKNVAFTGSYDQSGVDVYPKSVTPIQLHNTLLHGQFSIWGEPSGILAMPLSEAANAGATQLLTVETHSLFDNQLISYRSTNDEYYTAQVASTDGNTINLAKPLAAPIAQGQNLWNFYGDASHANSFGIKAVADLAIREIGIDALSSGKHVLFGDSWVVVPPSGNIATRLTERLANATIINKGTGGDKSADLLARFDADVSPENPDFVWVLVGINDAFSEVPVADYLSNMQAIIAKIKALGATPIIYDAPVAQLFGGHEQGSDFKTKLTHSYAEALGNANSLVHYQLTESVVPPPTDAISNAKTIVIDGDLMDWEGLEMFAQDADDISEAESKADFLEAGMAHDDTHFYVTYKNDIEIDTSVWWPWQVYLDTDNAQQTGFQSGNGVGSDFVIQGRNLYKYIGTGYNWAWQFVESAESDVNADIVELKFSRSAINNPDSLSAVLKARNGIFTGNYSSSGMDVYPDLNQGHFNYSFGDPEVPSLE